MENQNPKIEFSCLRVRQPIGDFYIGVMNNDDLVKISYADIRRLETNSEMREVEVYSGIQRELSPKRVTEIGRYVNTIDATFPTGIILHVNPEDAEFVEATQTMRLPFRDNVAKVLDGQHRIAGLEYFTQRGDQFQLNVTVFVGMELEDQAIVFATINKTQTKVNKSLVADLFAFAKTRSPQKTAHNIVRALNQLDNSPFKDKIKILGTAEDRNKETITQATFSESIVNLLSKDPLQDRDIYKRGKKPEKFYGSELQRRPFRNLFIDENDSKIAKNIQNYFSAVERKWPRAWREVRPEMILNRSTGFIALMRLFREIYINLGEIGNLYEVEDYYRLFEGVDLDQNSFTREIYIPGSGGQSRLYNDLRSTVGLRG